MGLVVVPSGRTRRGVQERMRDGVDLLEKALSLQFFLKASQANALDPGPFRQAR